MLPRPDFSCASSACRAAAVLIPARAAITATVAPVGSADRAAIPTPAVIADIGCGRGTTTLTLAGRFPRARIAAIDLSAALLTAAPNRTGSPGRAAAVRADFHRLPLADRACDLIVAAFCLYHSPDPASVITEIARCLTGDGTAVIAVKSADSYRELDRLMAASGLDPAAESHPSFYQAAHSGNITALAETGWPSGRRSTRPTGSPSRRSPTQRSTWPPHPSTTCRPPWRAPNGTRVTIDFDLTLAPFGYDLAKLIVTLTMTHGPIPAAAITEALSAYNLAANSHCPALPHVT